ncbi:Hsp20/alpha crystallin family protein [Virgibacillus xinjiangensis]|uniref:Hsp20/alpha crystallin family protein n=1 Tax=Virgibacillus xinjiangensis TaxID=393090 RepID=A0ABV7CYF4_9BACI
MSDFRPYRKKGEDLFQSLTKSLKDVFEHDVFSPLHGKFSSFRVDIKETRAAYHIQAELPGFSKEDITIEAGSDNLTIRAVRQSEKEAYDEGTKILRQERQYGEFIRQFPISNMKEDGIAAKLEDGMLYVEVPKKTPGKPAHKQIDIE